MTMLALYFRPQDGRRSLTDGSFIARSAASTEFPYTLLDIVAVVRLQFALQVPNRQAIDDQDAAFTSGEHKVWRAIEDRYRIEWIGWSRHYDRITVRVGSGRAGACCVQKLADRALFIKCQSVACCQNLIVSDVSARSEVAPPMETCDNIVSPITMIYNEEGVKLIMDSCPVAWLITHIALSGGIVCVCSGFDRVACRIGLIIPVPRIGVAP